MTNTYLSRSLETPTSQKKFTISFWFKNSGAGDGSTRYQWHAYKSSAGDASWLGLGCNGSGQFLLTSWYGQTNVTLSAEVKDPAAWSHVVVQVDTSQSTASDRVKFYLNGEGPITTLATNSYPTQDTTFTWAESAGIMTWGCAWNSSPATYGYTNGYLADCIYVDGQNIAPTVFGQTDSTTGEWKPKIVSGVTWGDSGSYLQFENSGAMGTDSSGNSNTFTVTSAPNNFQTMDTPSNNFMTMNRLDIGTDNNTVTRSGLRVDAGSTSGQSAQQHTRSTFALESGKWYWEMKVEANTASIGLLTASDSISATYSDAPYNIVEYNQGGEIRWRKEGSAVTKTTGIDTFTTGDIVMCALDMDNKRAYFGKNGVWQGDPKPDPATRPSDAGNHAPLLSNYFYHALSFDNSSGNSGRSDWNFGSPIFSISSGNTDGNSFGTFEYAVPSGYYAVCTKNINSYG